MRGWVGSPFRPIWISPSCNNTLATGNVRNLLNETVPNTNKQDAMRVLRQENNFTVLTDETDKNWPLTVNITNDETTNKMYILFENGNRSVSCTFNDIFDSQQDFILAISNDRGIANYSEKIDIYAMTVNITASSAPTIQPANDPTFMITANTNKSSITVNTGNPTIIDTSTPKWRLHNQGGIYPWYVFIIIFRIVVSVQLFVALKGHLN